MPWSRPLRAVILTTMAGRQTRNINTQRQTSPERDEKTNISKHCCCVSNWIPNTQGKPKLLPRLRAMNQGSVCAWMNSITWMVKILMFMSQTCKHLLQKNTQHMSAPNMYCHYLFAGTKIVTCVKFKCAKTNSHISSWETKTKKKTYEPTTRAKWPLMCCQTSWRTDFAV